MRWYNRCQSSAKLRRLTLYQIFQRRLRNDSNMKITVPIYIEQQQEAGQPASYVVRPLFFHEPVARDEELQRAVGKLAKALRRELDDAGKKMWHNELAGYSF